MAINLNRVVLAGNLTRDPEMRFTPAGTAVTNLRLAVNRQYTTREGERKKEVTFVTIVAWGKQAQSCQEYLKKGSPVLIEGRLQSRDWETEDNEKRTTLEVIAERVHFLARGREEEIITEEEGNLDYGTEEQKEE